MKLENLVFPGDFISNFNEDIILGENTYRNEEKILACVLGHIEEVNYDGKKTIKVNPIYSVPVFPNVNEIVYAKVSNITRLHVWVDIIGIRNTPVTSSFRALLRKQDIISTNVDQTEPALCYRPGDIIRARVIYTLGKDTSFIGKNEFKDDQITDESEFEIISMSKAVSNSVRANIVFEEKQNKASIFLSTAEPSLGVVLGFSRDNGNFTITSGAPMIPVAWSEMVDPHTLKRYPRKVAKISPDEIANFISAYS